MDAYEYLPAVTLCTMPCEQLAGPPGVFVVATSPLGMALMPTIGALHSKKSNQETRYKAVRTKSHWWSLAGLKCTPKCRDTVPSWR